ncbi:hypothetical protein Tco_0216741 [Tanacetum coccineum]
MNSTTEAIGILIHISRISCNNSYHTGNKAAPFETHYDQECQSPVCWTKVGVVESLAPTLNLETTKKIIRICNKIQAARNHRHSYADVRIRFDKRGKLNPRHIEPFKIIAKVGTVAYRLELPDQLSRVYSTFHVSNLKKCLPDETLGIPLDEIQIDDKLNFVEEPVEIIDREVMRLKQSRINYVKVRWNSRRGAELTWEHEDRFQKKYSHLIANFAPSSNATT